MDVFPASWDAFQLLQRLVFRGPMPIVNDELAAELIGAGLASVEADELVATPAGVEAERSSMHLPSPPQAA